SLSAWCSRRLPSVPHWVTPNALRQFQTALVLTPNQHLIATADSLRTARTSSSVTSRPEPPAMGAEGPAAWPGNAGIGPGRDGDPGVPVKAGGALAAADVGREVGPV